ncbi:L-seryl-tRNA(Sec) selenium transferase [Helicobacter sp.]|uniref:L-seryl-tRNA(Sec) selenium transferase n=1 Tax=Helicobacter sp. TaxID=218 RepID=UPI002A7D2B40|nr:L-seryl-tRNA(Sec) selenium transferase [Helicobacter sp.]MDY2823540.1 L-seryl-tRNA(Sec) selenium transferase [Helicobacter sp.]
MHTQELLQALPKVDTLLAHKQFETYNTTIIKSLIQQHIHTLRQAILQNTLMTTYPEIALHIDSGSMHTDSTHTTLATYITHTLLQSITNDYHKLTTPSLVPVVNASGVVLQTNLGRSVFAPNLMQQILPLLTRYSNLEYDITQGKRSSRYTHANTLLKALFSQEYDYVLVNNNAAAVFLILNTFAKDKEVIISRGELIEIGGEFRIPEVMKSAGSVLVEVGATNKTHLLDYQTHITPHTAMLMKAHKSNFAQIGFCQEVSMQELSTLAHTHNLIDYYDLGSGCVMDLALATSLSHTQKEPTLHEIFTSPPSLLSFSGDKLFGASQVGIIAGKPHLIAQLKQNHLLRALRVDKLCISVLQATLQAYLHNALESIPTLAMLTLTPQALRQRALELLQMLQTHALSHIQATIIEVDSVAGGGSLPDKVFQSVALALTSDKIHASALESHLRTEFHIITRIHKQQVLIDVRTLLEGDTKRICQALETIDHSLQSQKS